LFSIVCHPQTDAQIKVVNRTLTQLLRAIIKRNLKSWEECLPHIEFAYNRITHSTTSFSSFEIVYGLNPLIPLDLVLLSTGELSSLDGKKKIEIIKAFCEMVKANIEKKNESIVLKCNQGQ
jgi:hypothetical protein